jgi:hypothetical protein
MYIYCIYIVNASQGHIHEHEKTKRKLYICNANIYFNRPCIHRNKYIYIYPILGFTLLFMIHTV